MTQSYTKPWYVPKTKEEAKLFEQAKSDVKSYLAVNKEGVRPHQLFNFMVEQGISIPYEKFGLTFNQFLFHLDDIIDTRILLPHFGQGKIKYLFLNGKSVDPDLAHVVRLVQEQITERKRNNGTPRVTLGNTRPVQIHELLDAPPPRVYAPPASTGVARRGYSGFTNKIYCPPHRAKMSTPAQTSVDTRRDVGGDQRHAPIPGTSQPSTSQHVAPSTLPLPMPPHLLSSSGRANLLKPTPQHPLVNPSAKASSQEPYLSAPTVSPIKAPLPPPVVVTKPLLPGLTSTFVGTPLPTATTTYTLHQNNVQYSLTKNDLPPPGTCSPPKPISKLIRETEAISIVTKFPTVYSIARSSAGTPAPLPDAAQSLKPPPEAAIPVPVTKAPPPPPEGVEDVKGPSSLEVFEPPATACCFDITKFKEYPNVVSIEDQFIMPLTITGCKHGDPRTFTVKFEDVKGEVAHHEKNMKTYFDYMSLSRRAIDKKDVVINGFYAGKSTRRNAWYRVQVLKIKHGVEKPLHVFLIDHGTYMDLDLEDLAYLKRYQTTGLMRYAFNATCDNSFGSNGVSLSRDMAATFMDLNTGRSFYFLMKREALEEGPILKLKFLRSVDKVELAEADDYKFRAGVVF